MTQISVTTNCGDCKYARIVGEDRPEDLPKAFDYLGINFTCEKGQTGPVKKCLLFEQKENKNALSSKI